MRIIESVWAGDSSRDRIARALLSPFAVVFRGIVATRSQLYENGVLKTKASSIPVISVGNLTVGGTGKTPFSAWIASKLAQNGRSPAIVLRGYGGDESLVHKVLNPAVPVVEAVDRVSGIEIAAHSGADVAILDDAFQHRRAARDVDIVLVSADDWSRNHHVLPAGPYREPVSGLRRASVVVVTTKAAVDTRVDEVETFVRRMAPGVLVATARLHLTSVVMYQSPERAFEPQSLRGKSVLAVAAIGNPRAFFAQLESFGARVTAREFRDHHVFTRSEILDIAARSAKHDYVICTLKDAVKLGPEWPADANPLWYVSLSVNVENGAAALDEILSRIDRPRDL